MNSASLCSLAGRYDNPIPPRFLDPIGFLKIPAQEEGILTWRIKKVERRDAGIVLQDANSFIVLIYSNLISPDVTTTDISSFLISLLVLHLSVFLKVRSTNSC